MISDEQLKFDGMLEDAYERGYQQAKHDYEIQPCKDAVSREVILSMIEPAYDSSGYLVDYVISRKKIAELPPVTLKQRTGVWVKLQKNGDGTSRYMCSECGDTKQLSRHTFATFRFCPNCGAKMEGENK